MTTTEPHVCRRCKGSGHEPDRPDYRAPHRRVLDQLAELGAERAPLVATKAYTRTDGRTRYNAIITKARKLIERGEELGVLSPDMMAALGVTSPAYYKIRNGQTGV